MNTATRLPANNLIEQMPTEQHIPGNIVSMPIPAAPPMVSFAHSLARMLSDTTMPIDRIIAGHAMLKEERALDHEAKFNHALAAAQAEMTPVIANAKNDQTRSKYATYDALNGMAAPIFTKHGFAVSFTEEEGARDGYVRIVGLLSLGAHTRRYQHDEARDGKGPKGNDVMSKTHAGGAAISYGRRYLLGMIFNLVVDRDNDGNAQRAPGINSNCLTTAELDEIRMMVEEAGGGEITKRVARLYADTDRLEDIPRAMFVRAKAKLQTTIDANAKKGN